jgi:hypothetical protein
MRAFGGGGVEERCVCVCVYAGVHVCVLVPMGII